MNAHNTRVRFLCFFSSFSDGNSMSGQQFQQMGPSVDEAGMKTDVVGRRRGVHRGEWK